MAMLWGFLLLLFFFPCLASGTGMNANFIPGTNCGVGPNRIASPNEGIVKEGSSLGPCTLIKSRQDYDRAVNWKTSKKVITIDAPPWGVTRMLSQA